MTIKALRGDYRVCLRCLDGIPLKHPIARIDCMRLCAIRARMLSNHHTLAIRVLPRRYTRRLALSARWDRIAAQHDKEARDTYAALSAYINGPTAGTIRAYAALGNAR